MYEHRLCEIRGFRRDAAEYCALLRYYAASSGNLLLTFRDNLSAPSSGFKSVINYFYSLRTNAEERSSQRQDTCPFHTDCQYT